MESNLGVDPEIYGDWLTICTIPLTVTILPFLVQTILILLSAVSVSLIRSFFCEILPDLHLSISLTFSYVFDFFFTLSIFKPASFKNYALSLLFIFHSFH